MVTATSCRSSSLRRTAFCACRSLAKACSTIRDVAYAERERVGRWASHAPGPPQLRAATSQQPWIPTPWTMRLRLPTVVVPQRVLAGDVERASATGVAVAASRPASGQASAWQGYARVTGVLFLEDFGPVDAGELHHVVSREALDAMFRELRRTGKQIVVDVHTHPRGHTTLSPTDRAHPIEFRPGYSRWSSRTTRAVNLCYRRSARTRTSPAADGDVFARHEVASTLVVRDA